MAITYLRSPAVPRNMQATRMEGNPIGKGSVIGKDAAPIPVMHQDADGSFRQMPSVTTASVPEQATTDPLPPDAGESRSKPEYQVAVDQALPQVTGLAAPGPANPRLFTPPPSPAPSQPPAPQQPIVQPSTKRVRVRMSNRGMGRVTVSVRAVSISDSCVVLAYPLDADNIVEPPVCGGDNPIKVEYEGKSYQCVFGGWTTELEGLFLVIMLLTGEPEEPAKA